MCGLCFADAQIICHHGNHGYNHFRIAPFLLVLMQMKRIAMAIMTKTTQRAKGVVMAAMIAVTFVLQWVKYIFISAPINT